MNTSTRYSLLRNIYEPIEESTLKQAIAEVKSLTFLDAKRQIRNQNYGYVLSHVGGAQAIQLHQILNDYGIETLVVPDSEIYLPPLMAGQAIELMQEGISVLTQLNQTISFSWHEIVVVATGLVPKLQTSTRSTLGDVTESDFPALYQQRFQRKEITAEARLEIVLNEQIREDKVNRLYFTADRIRFPQDFLDTAEDSESTVDLLARLQKTIKHLAPQASLNRTQDDSEPTDKKMFNSRDYPHPRNYPTLEHFHDEIAWLYWHSRQARINGSIRDTNTKAPASAKQEIITIAEPIENEFNVPDLISS